MANLINLDDVNNLKIELFNLKKNNPGDSCHLKTIDFYITIVDTIQLYMHLYYKNVNITTQSEAYYQDSIILNNAQLLSDYYNSLQKRLYIFDNVEVTAPLLTIKPEYAIYNQMYGQPINFLYDPEKLQAIKNQLALQPN